MRRAAKIDRDVAAWHCAECGIEKPGTAHQRRQTYCSRECMAKGYAKRLTGEANPNYSGAAKRLCERCGGSYESHQPTRKFCSSACYNATRPKKEPRQHRPLKLVTPKKTVAKRVHHMVDCQQCGISFRSSPSCNRQFCSYQCHLDSGGAQRAGQAAARATMKYGVKKDANHNELFAVLRQHCAVYDLSSAGFGLPDGIAWVDGKWHLFDVKNPKTGYGKRGLNPVQKKWLTQWNGGPVFLLYTAEDALNFATGKHDRLKVFPEAAIGIAS